MTKTVHVWQFLAGKFHLVRNEGEARFGLVPSALHGIGGALAVVGRPEPATRSSVRLVSFRCGGIISPRL